MEYVISYTLTCFFGVGVILIPSKKVYQLSTSNVWNGLYCPSSSDTMNWTEGICYMYFETN